MGSCVFTVSKPGRVKKKDFCKVGDGIACLPRRGTKSQKGKDTAKLNGVVWSSGSRRMSGSNLKAIVE